ncbi:MAG TPA: FadR/GntR family transcriptional regulator [Roseiflexaceae bacterium]|nr:FadR/GntR family transcriptional regulator [Roseiflexaceae bacterium]HMP43151.1 FadR/GntR family transcriptional regulator [Roseiflexaceae bacterium]
MSSSIIVESERGVSVVQSSTTQVYAVVLDAIQQRIANGQWQPGHRLPSITRIADELGVSPGSVREAARVLATRGILRIEHGRGMFVTASPAVPLNLYQHFDHVDAGSTLELFEARRLLEPELAALAAERGSDAELAQIGILALRMEQAVAEGADFFDPDIQFHQQIAVAARNDVLAGIMASISSLIVAGRTLTVTLPGMTARAVRYHLLIAEAIRYRRPLQARLLMLAHVNDAIDALVDMYGRHSSVHGSASDEAVIVNRRTHPQGRGKKGDAAGEDRQ